MIENGFRKAALETLRETYPERAAKLDHGLAGHPLFELDALVALARRMRPEDSEYNRGDIPVGIDPAATPANGLSVEETIRSIEQCGSWMVLKFVEQDPDYCALMDALLAQIEPLVRQSTGAMLKKEAFIFISSPGAVTPFHFDPEHNILLQLRGSKTMTVFPADDEGIASGVSHEDFHNGGHRNLPWRDDFALKGKAFVLGPGEAVYVPVKSPHWVRNGPEVSVSFSVTWRSRWSEQEAEARGMNRLLRQAGLNPAPPKRFPGGNATKSLAYRGFRKAQHLLKSD